MTRLVPTLFFFLLWLSLHAQEPAIISAEYIVDDFPGFLDIADCEEAGIWDFSEINTMKRIRVGDLKGRNSEIPFIGEVKLDDQDRITDLRTINLLGGYKKRWAELSRSLSINKPYADEVQLAYEIIVSASDVEQLVLDQLPIIPDSLKISFTAKINDVDASDVQLIFNESKRAVNYFKRIIEIEQATFIKIEPFGWEAVNEIAPMIQWDEAYSIEQRFFVDETIQRPIAILNNGKDGLQAAFLIFKESVGGGSAPNPEIKAVPNPVISNLRFELDNLLPGRYVIRIKNILGEQKIEKAIDYSKPDAIPIDIENLRKGSYFYILEDASGSIITTKRLIVLKP